MINFIVGLVMLVAIDIWFELDRKEAFFAGMLIFTSMDVYAIKRKLEDKE